MDILQRIVAIALFAGLLQGVALGPALAEDRGGDGMPVEQPTRPLILDSIQIEGNTRTRDDIIHAHLGIQAGDAVDVDVFEAARMRLVDTGYFRDVTFSTRPGGERGTVVLVVEVEERRASFETGFGYDALDGWFLTLLGVRVDNSFGTESRLRLGWRLGFRVSGLDAEWDQTLKPGGPFGVTVRGYIFNRRHLFFGSGPTQGWAGDSWNRYEQNITNIGGEVALRYDLEQDATRFWFGIRARVVEPDTTFNQFNEDSDLGFEDLPDPLKADSGRNTITGFFLRGVRDTRDSDVYPTRGSFALLKLEANNSLLGGDQIFTKSTLDARRHFALGGGHVVSARASGGIMSRGAPYYERFYIGGNYSIRGFEEWSLSATDGDDGYWLVNTELRAPLVTWRGGQPRLTGLLFVDAGQGWHRSEGTREVEVGVGYGFRLRLPWAGTLGLDAGVPLTDGRTGDPFRVHLLLGFSF